MLCILCPVLVDLQSAPGPPPYLDSLLLLFFATFGLEHVLLSVARLQRPTGTVHPVFSHQQIHDAKQTATGWVISTKTNKFFEPFFFFSLSEYQVFIRHPWSARKLLINSSLPSVCTAVRCGFLLEQQTCNQFDFISFLVCPPADCQHLANIQKLFWISHNRGYKTPSAPTPTSQTTLASGRGPLLQTNWQGYKII